MPEFIGTGNSIAIQKRLQNRQSRIACSPDLANGGRVLHFLDPETTGWNRVAELALEDGLAGFPVVPFDQTVAQIERHLGAHWKTPVWHALLGSDDQVLTSCDQVVRSVGVPDSWQVEMNDCPTDNQIAEVQALNHQTGVSPYPAYYMRSEAVPVLTAGLRDAVGALVATASVAYRYHSDSRLAGHVFAGMVSVSEDHRGLGMGKLINALVLIESQRRFAWKVATEQVAPDNVTSRAMIVACGMDHSAKLTSIAATNSGERFSR